MFKITLWGNFIYGIHFGSHTLKWVSRQFFKYILLIRCTMLYNNLFSGDWTNIYQIYMFNIKKKHIIAVRTNIHKIKILYTYIYIIFVLKIFQVLSLTPHTMYFLNPKYCITSIFKLKNHSIRSDMIFSFSLFFVKFSLIFAHYHINQNLNLLKIKKKWKYHIISSSFNFLNSKIDSTQNFSFRKRIICNDI